jgi:isocitrate dehydrogenase kinase/phosphatase
VPRRGPCTGAAHPTPTIIHRPMPSHTAARVAETIAEAYAALAEQHGALTRRAGGRFARREWRDWQADAAERLELFPRSVAETVDAVREVVQAGWDEAHAVEAKWLFVDRIAERDDHELAETFYNSVVRRVFATVGVDASAEFTETVPVRGRAVHRSPAWRTYEAPDGITADLIAAMLGDAGPDLPWRDLSGDADAAARSAAADLRRIGCDSIARVEALPSLFYRNKGAYLVVRIRPRDGGSALPLVIALTHPEDGVCVDAVLTTADEASVVFGFTRSYFHVETDRPCAVVEFLESVMPLKPVHELYTAIGYHKHGKTELYRSLRDHLRGTDARFEPAEGIPGMVMAVFTLPSQAVVFKVIKDRFAEPKDTSRARVKAKYDLVFRHDRVGRLADAQEFEHVRFPRRCFPDDLLDSLVADAGETVVPEGDSVVVRHMYTERRVRPLNLFLREAPADEARDAVVDYGQAIKDLAAANLFPGDLLLKNFGVTRHGRVLFYDYDEISLLTECRFRALPTARNDEDEMSAEPFFSVDDGDVFPEEFLPFLVPQGPLREAFLEMHGDLLTPRFWRAMQDKQAAGDIPDFYPYRQSRRLRR